MARKLRLTISDFYKDLPEGVKKRISKADYLKMNRVFFSVISKMIMEEGKFLKINNVGSIGVSRFITNKKPLFDFPHYVKTGERIRRRLSLDGDYIARWTWDKRKSMFKNKRSFAFQPIRANKKELAKSIRTKGTMNKYILDL